MLYCNREHQASDRPSHKRVCIAVKKAQRNLDQEQAHLLALPGDMFFEADPFTNSVGHFWGIVQTRDYMQSRFVLVDRVTNVGTLEAVKTALNHAMDMLRLCRSDNLGVRHRVPHFMLRLNQDQNCYDFLKWYSTMGEDSNYDWSDMHLPFLNVKNADAFEPNLPNLIGPGILISHEIAMLLLKTKLYLDLMDVRNASSLGARAPQEIVDDIQRQNARSPLTLANSSIISGKVAVRELNISELRDQMEELFKAVEKRNKNFWQGFLNPGDHLLACPEYFSPGSKEEMQITLQYSYTSWKEIPDALKLVRARIETGKWTQT
jgi:hypothetical protein